MKRGRMLLCLLISVLVLALACPAAFAAEPFEADQDCILIVDYRSEGQPVPGARFAIYRVADLDADLTITLSGDFAASGVELNGLTAAQFADAAEALCAYAAGAELTAHYTAVTDDSGRLVLSGIPVGVYLVVGEPTVAGERKHFSDPQLVALPQEDAEGQEWDYTVAYIGYLELPTLGLTLPVIGESTADDLKLAPCRFFGSPYLDDLVIGAHNYRGHFGSLSGLFSGDPVIFTDMAGNVFVYEVADFEVLEAYEGSELCNGQWDLSLFTCTVSGRTRLTVRCDRVN